MNDAFKNFFANIGNYWTENIPCVNKSPLQYLTAPSQGSLFLFPTKTVGLNANKSAGPHSIPVAILKATKHISAPLEIIFNTSFSTGIVPDLFEIAKFTRF